MSEFGTAPPLREGESAGQGRRWGRVARREVRGAPSPHRISLRLRLDFFDSPSRVIL